MAARLNPKQDERSRSKIQTSQLCNRLNLFALGLPDPCSPSKKPIEMSEGQIRAALGLLRKTLPDLAVTQLEGAGGGALLVDFRWSDGPVVANATTAVADETTKPVTIEAADTDVVWSDGNEC